MSHSLCKIFTDNTQMAFHEQTAWGAPKHSRRDSWGFQHCVGCATEGRGGGERTSYMLISGLWSYRSGRGAPWRRVYPRPYSWHRTQFRKERTRIHLRVQIETFIYDTDGKCPYVTGKQTGHILLSCPAYHDLPDRRSGSRRRSVRTGNFPETDRRLCPQDPLTINARLSWRWAVGIPETGLWIWAPHWWFN